MGGRSEKKQTPESYLVEELKRTGYPLEIEVSPILEKDYEYAVHNNEYYFDSDEGKYRIGGFQSDTRARNHNKLAEYYSGMVKCIKGVLSSRASTVS